MKILVGYIRSGHAMAIVDNTDRSIYIYFDYNMVGISVISIGDELGDRIRQMRIRDDPLSADQT